MLNNNVAIDAIVSMLMAIQDQDNVNLPILENELRETNIGIQNMLNAIQQGILTKSTKERLDQLEATKEGLEKKIACEKLEKPRISEDFLRFWLCRFRKLDVTQKSHRKMLIDTFVNAIFLYDDKVVITFNFREGSKTITFSDLQQAIENRVNGSDMNSVTPLPGALKIKAPGFSYVCGRFQRGGFWTQKWTQTKTRCQKAAGFFFVVQRGSIRT